MSQQTREAFVIGSGPNGLTAAVLLARAGFRTTVFEAQSTIGGGVRSAELTLPGFTHDVCSAVHPMAASSPVFRTFPLEEHGLQWIQPPVPVAHPLDGGRCALIQRSVNVTAESLGPDRERYRQVFGPLVRNWHGLTEDILRPLKWPKHPLLLARFGAFAPWPAKALAERLFQTAAAQALFAGNAAHSFLPLNAPVSSAVGLVMQITAHAVGWPIPRGGSQRIAEALASYFRSLGGTIITGTAIRTLREFRPGSLILADITPRQLISIGGDRLPERYLRTLARYRYGPGVFKVDWALDGPIPWASSACSRSATVHVCGTMEEVAASEHAVSEGREPHKPFVLLAQSSLFDATRAPAGKHTGWAYCHVPNGSRVDMTDQIEAQVERFAPGFKKLILARHTMDTAQMEHHNENLVGGDINGGNMDILQMFRRPSMSWYGTPEPGLYLCSSSTPPGGAVHGMCGYNAVELALRNLNPKRPN